MPETKTRKPREITPRQILILKDSGFAPSGLGEFDSRADALSAIEEGGKIGESYLIAEAKTISIEEPVKRLKRKLV